MEMLYRCWNFGLVSVVVGDAILAIGDRGSDSQSPARVFDSIVGWPDGRQDQYGGDHDRCRLGRIVNRWLGAFSGGVSASATSWAWGGRRGHTRRRKHRCAGSVGNDRTCLRLQRAGDQRIRTDSHLWNIGCSNAGCRHSDQLDIAAGL